MNFINSTLGSLSIISIIIILLVPILLNLGYFVLYKRIYKGKYSFEKKQIVLITLLIGYYLIVLAGTLFGRENIIRPEGIINFDILRGYRVAWNNFSLVSFQDIIINIALLFPVGFLLPLISNFFKKAGAVLLVVFSTSLFIEIIQFVTDIGRIDISDVLHNTLGGMLGYCISNLLIVFLDKQSVPFKQIVKYISLPVIVCLLTFGIVISYEMQEFGNLRINPETKMDMSDITMKTTISLDADSKKMPVYKFKKNSSEQIKIKDIEIISSKEAFQKLKRGEFLPLESLKKGDIITITKCTLSSYSDTKDFQQPVYQFEGIINGKQGALYYIAAKK
ncbi:VanZ family protein [Bacillus mycoides]|uniref:VanZ family protein n=1 Tax=Bacillus mycoides TaxID=1405 RepID=UPI003CF1FDEB